RVRSISELNSARRRFSASSFVFILSLSRTIISDIVLPHPLDNRAHRQSDANRILHKLRNRLLLPERGNLLLQPPDLRLERGRRGLPATDRLTHVLLQAAQPL